MALGVRARCLSTTGICVEDLQPHIQRFIQDQAKLCKPDKIHVCDGSEAENKAILEQLLKDGRVEKLPKYDNW